MTDFSDIAVGDTVLVSNRLGRSLRKVSRVTKTLFSVSGLRFKRSDGRQFGADTWNHAYACIPTAEDIAAVRQEQDQKQAVDAAKRLQQEIASTLDLITSRNTKGWALSIGAANEHLRNALLALQVKLTTTTEP